jgi:hypothetical protein
MFAIFSGIFCLFLFGSWLFDRLERVMSANGMYTNLVAIQRFEWEEGGKRMIYGVLQDYYEKFQLLWD